jgi:hypothetical protein
VSSGRLNSI